jgi:hypothetical protein
VLPFWRRRDQAGIDGKSSAVYNPVGHAAPLRRSRTAYAADRNRAPHPQEEATRPSGFNSLQQQERSDVFVQEFNAERPHEALDMRCSAELSTASTRHHNGLRELTYPFHDRDVLVTACGRICFNR